MTEILAFCLLPGRADPVAFLYAERLALSLVGTQDFLDHSFSFGCFENLELERFPVVHFKECKCGDKDLQQQDTLIGQDRAAACQACRYLARFCQQIEGVVRDDDGIKERTKGQR